MWAAALAACVVLAWIAFVRADRVPLLSAADLGFHELGHMLFMWAPEGLYTFAGSGTQVAVPLGLAAYFGFARRDRLAAALMLAWAATSAQNVSVYIADAPYERLELIGGYHDWAFLLAGSLGSAAPLAHAVWTFGLLLALAALGLCVAALAVPAVR